VNVVVPGVAKVCEPGVHGPLGEGVGDGASVHAVASPVDVHGPHVLVANSP